MAKEGNVGSSSQPASASNGTSKQSVTGKTSTVKELLRERLMLQALLLQKLLLLLRKKLRQWHCKRLVGKSAQQIRTLQLLLLNYAAKPSENAKMERKIAEL